MLGSLVPSGRRRPPACAGAPAPCEREAGGRLTLGDPAGRAAQCAPLGLAVVEAAFGYPGRPSGSSE
eukprot:1059780-Alexandrium_andersonii.AAC.1